MKILTNIPGFERRKLHCIDCNNNFSKVLLAGKLIGELRSKYCTSVAYFSTRGTAKDIEAIQKDYSGLTGALYTENLKSRDCLELCDRIAEMAEKRFIRAIVIDSIEGLDISDFEGSTRAKRKEIKTNLFLTAASCNIPILLFCPHRRSVEYDTSIDPLMVQILPQMDY